MCLLVVGVRGICDGSVLKSLPESSPGLGLLKVSFLVEFFVGGGFSFFLVFCEHRGFKGLGLLGSACFGNLNLFEVLRGTLY